MNFLLTLPQSLGIFQEYLFLLSSINLLLGQCGPPVPLFSNLSNLPLPLSNLLPLTLSDLTPPLSFLLSSFIASKAGSSIIERFRRPISSTPLTLTCNLSPTFKRSDGSFTKSPLISDTCTSPSFPGRISTNAPKVRRRLTSPSYISPAFGSLVIASTLEIPASSSSSVVPAIWTTPSSSTSIWQFVSAIIFLIVLPPGPMSSPIL